MAGLDQEKTCWTLYPPLLSILKTDKERNHLEEAAMAHQCGRFTDANALYEHNLPTSSSIPMLAMEHADMLTTQGLERDRIKLLETTLNRHKLTNNGVATNDLLLLELMLLDAYFWAYGKMEGLLDKARQVREQVSQVDINDLSDLELRAITLYYQIVNSCKTVSNFVRTRDETIFEESGNRASEARKLRESLIARKKYNIAFRFMQLELTLVQGLEMQASVGASLALCSTMEQTQNKSLLFRSTRLGRQLSSILANVIPPMAEQVSQHSLELLRQNFSPMEAQCPGISLDLAVKQVRDSPSTEGEKSRKYMDLANAARKRKDFTKANQALIAARDAAQKNWHQRKTLPSGRAVLQHLHDVHTAYIDLHQRETGMAYFESAGVADYLTTLSVHYKDNSKILRIIEDFQGRYVDYGLPTHQERMFGLADSAERKLALKDQSQLYFKQHSKWLKQCPFSDQMGKLTESAQSDPDHYLRQIFGNVEDPIEWGNNALDLLLTWAKIEVEKGLLTKCELRKLFGFVQKDDQDDNPDSFFDYINDLDFEEVAECLYDDPNASKRLANLPDRPPSQAARLDTAKIIMISRLHRHRLYLASQGVPSPTSSVEYSEEQKMLDAIEKLEDAVGGGFGDQSDRQMAGRIQTTLTKCYVPESVKQQLVSDEELQSRISECADLVSKYANGGRRFMEYHTLLQQSRLHWQRYLLFKSVPPDASHEVLERAERLFNSTRKQLLTPDPADLLPAIINQANEFMSQEHSKMGIMASFQSFLENKAASQNVDDLYDRFLKWTNRSKGRGLIDLLYFDVEVVQDLVETLSSDRGKLITSGADSDTPSSVEKLHIAENTKLQDETEQESATDRVTPTALPIDITDNTIVSKDMINEMLSEVGDDVVLVDIINIAYLGEGGLQAILYRQGATNLPIPLPDITLKAVEGWVEKNLGTERISIKKPLREEGHTSALEELTPLLMPLFNPKLPHSIKAKETIIFCLTGALHQIPIHAIPISDVPLIESHPVAYCQSLTTLYRSYEAVCKSQLSSPSVYGLTIVPSYEKQWMNEAEAEEKLLQEVERITTSLKYSGSDLTKEATQNVLSGCAHILYFGHVYYNPTHPIESALLLNESAYKEQSLEKPDSERIAVRDLFKVQLHKPALATIIGCGSGKASISDSDEILGLPSALMFAGASAIVSTLWRIDPDDGANFAAAFYEAIHEHQVVLEDKKSDNQDLGYVQVCVNLTSAMHEAVKILRQRGEKKDAVYHWAAFYLTGFWLFPRMYLN
ncbi:hypothetical protein JMJ35_007202 [Cladonia borealis]|uniref:CHAT domain-containing protein n=1 Tax=Cladonia borealis TaxID=184061 RepID=A0AA39QZ47_9LECA|nr:hypothetical protein JMJ35_007202 [Cladonia borealis]